jgi:iron complex outermembrane receptor protein
MKYIFGILLWVLTYIGVYAQSASISGTVVDEQSQVLSGALVLLNNGERQVPTTSNGHFNIYNLNKGEYHLHITYLGYQCIDTTVVFDGEDLILKLQMKKNFEQLHEVEITDHAHENRNKEEALSVEFANEEYLQQNRGGSLMQSLKRLPGLSTIEIGSGQSKPVIRGLSFNRVVVVENGIKHEGQQWGLEHGLEIDQFAVSHVEIIKGPASLQYGSDAIGGVIDIHSPYFPEKYSLKLNLETNFKSNNLSYGGSVNIEGRSNKLFFGTRFTKIEYADFRVPADSVSIYDYREPLVNQRLRNTAGNEQAFHLNFGFIDQYFNSTFYLSNYQSKAGFFANAHGLEPVNVDKELHDASIRDIKQPYHDANHFKITNKTNMFYGKHHITLDIGYQKNFRQEWSPYTSDDGRPLVFPDNLSFPEDLEREYDKDVLSLNLKDGMEWERNKLSFGVNSEYQNNRIDGRGFLIPAYQQITTGAFVYDRYKLNEKWLLHAGVRFDYGHIQTEDYFDWYKSYMEELNDSIYVQRAQAINKSFSSFSWSVGVNYNEEHFSSKLNIGKSFRMPIAKELAANGKDYHMFRYAIGDENLHSEISYQIDWSASWYHPLWALQISPFFNYFTNYIYLNPTPDFYNQGGLNYQIFEYVESEVMRFGGELHAHYNIMNKLKLGAIIEYLYAEQMAGPKKGFGLPFAPPPAMIYNLKYVRDFGKSFRQIYFSLDYQYTFKQDQIVPPETVTDAYQIIHFSMGGDIYWGSQKLELSLQIRNILDTKYYNHTSYYKLIDLPEAGRNFVINLKIPIEIINN